MARCFVCASYSDSFRCVRALSILGRRSTYVSTAAACVKGRKWTSRTRDEHK